jgi:hypothetical protein
MKYTSIGKLPWKKGPVRMPLRRGTFRKQKTDRAGV